MKTIGDRQVSGTVGGVDENVVVVAMRLDSQSKGLLSWTLGNVVRPHCRVVAVHVLDGIERSGGTESLFSVVKAFDRLFLENEGICKVKQVDLKLRMCKGSSVRRILVREAKTSFAAAIIVGTSQSYHRIRSSTSVAKYCARKLSKHVSVIALDNGKIVFQRGENPEKSNHLQENSTQRLHQPQKQEITSSLNPEIKPFLPTSFTSSPSVNGFAEPKHGWSLLRWVFLSKQQSAVKWLLKIPSWNTYCVVHAGDKKTVSSFVEEGGLDFSVPDRDFSETVLPKPTVTLSDGMPEELHCLYTNFSSSSCVLFSYDELLLATRCFSPENLVGKGGSSRVYRGHFHDGKELAVKTLISSPSTLTDLAVEIEIITSLKHKNILSLLGFCFAGRNLLLVHNFFSRGNLQENLHKKNEKNLLDWKKRYKVAVGVAEAIDYLHNGSDQSVIHRDVKSSNILISDDFEPQLSDFGLACWAPSSSSHCSDVKGTFGYLAPEYLMYGTMSEKVDVFAFGVVLLELISGRMAIDCENLKEQESLVMWAKPILQSGNVTGLLDVHMSCVFDEEQLERMVLAAILSVRYSPLLRPPISIILKLLRGDDEVVNWANQQVRNLEHVVADADDGDEFSAVNVRSCLNLALLDVEADSTSVSSCELEDYVQRISCLPIQ